MKMLVEEQILKVQDFFFLYVKVKRKYKSCRQKLKLLINSHLMVFPLEPLHHQWMMKEIIFVTRKLLRGDIK